MSLPGSNQPELAKSVPHRGVCRCIGLIGGLTPEASAICTHMIHEEVRRLRGVDYSANLRCALLDHHELAMYCANREWSKLEDRLGDTARTLVQGGAEALLLDSSTLHVAAKSMESATNVPIVHVVEVCRRALVDDKITCVGLLGTRCGEEEQLWWDLLGAHDIDVVLPSRPDRCLVADAINTELIFGRVKEASRVRMIRTMKALKRAGARAVVVVAPELLSVAFGSDTALNFYAAARLQVCAAVEWACARGPHHR